MKFSALLCAQHLGRMTNRHWYIQGKRIVRKTRAEQLLKEAGFEVHDGEEVIYKKDWGPLEKLKFVGAYEKQISLDENHPDYKTVPCLIMGDNDVLVEGLNQAKLLTNTVELDDGLPEMLVNAEESLSVSDKVHDSVQKSVLLSCVFEAMQQKLSKKKDPSRPAWIFPRDYGITDVHKNYLLCKNLLTILERNSKKVKERNLIENAEFSVPLNAHEKLLNFQQTSEVFITSGKLLSKICNQDATSDLQLPHLHPLHPTVSIKPFHFFRFENIFPVLNKACLWPYAHTALVHFNPTQVLNTFDSEVTSDQKQSRGLLKGFTIAAAQARAIYGHDFDSVLPAPVVVQVVQTDGQEFQFSVYQLNTLDVNSRVKNVWWNSPSLQLYSRCCYHMGRPVLDDYNPAVFNRLLAFYNNGS